MPLFRDTPIRRKLMTMMLVNSGVVLLLTCATFVGYELLTYRQAAVRQLATLGEIIAADSTGAVAFDNQRDATEILAALKADRHIVAACLYDKRGRIFARHPAQAPDAAFPPAPGEDGYRFAQRHLIGFTPLVQTRGSERFGTLYLRSDMEAISERLRLYGGIALLAVLVVSLIAYGLSRTLQREISRPILALAEAARAVSDRNDYTVRAARHGDDEVGDLTDAFNLMLAQIQEQNALLERRVQERTAELAAANDELEAFCSSAAHDLRTPLRTITGFADVLLDPRGRLSPADAQHYLSLIRDGSGQMSKLIEDLLAFSRLGRQALTREVVDLQRLVQEVFDRLGSERSGRRIEWRLGPLPPVEGDAALLRVVFVNLLSNALKYTRPRPIAVIEAGVVADGDGPPVCFVRDNGVGFAMADAEKLFGIFQRLHHAHEFEGTGVGLATVRRIIDRHGGRIWAEAEPDAGATFYFTLTSRAD
jgi:signal transduction histidine kinase